LVFSLTPWEIKNLFSFGPAKVYGNLYLLSSNFTRLLELNPIFPGIILWASA